MLKFIITIPIIITTIILVSFILFCILIIIHSNKNNTRNKGYNRYTRFVNDYSDSITKIKDINRNYQFYNINLPVYSHDYDNQKLYNEVSCYDYLVYQLQFSKIREEVMNAMDDVDCNNTLYNRYLSEIKDIQLGKFSIEPEELKIDKLLEEEKRVFAKYNKL